MKKVVLSLALVALMSISFVSCKETAKEAPVTEETSVEETPTPTSAEAPAEEAAVSETTETE